MKNVCSVVILILAILVAVQMSPAKAQHSGRDMRNDPAYIESQAKVRASLQAPIIAMHGHWHDGFFEMKLKTPIKNKILDVFAHYGDGFKPLPTDQEILDSVLSKSDQDTLGRENRIRKYLYDCNTTWNGNWDGNCCWFYTHRLPKSAKEEAKYQERFIRERSGKDIEDRAKKMAQLEKAQKAKENEEISRQRKYDEAIAKYNKYLEKNLDVKIAIDREQAEIDRLEHEEWEKSDVGMLVAEIKRNAIIEAHEIHLKQLAERKKQLAWRNEVLVQKEAETKKWRDAANAAKNKDPELEKEAAACEWSLNTWRKVMEIEAKKWAERKVQIKEQDSKMGQDLLDQE